MSLASNDREVDERERSALYRELITSYIEKGRRSRLSLVVIGEAGQGKSTLINALVGQQIAKEGDDFRAGTTGLGRYQLSQHGVSVDIWDTPGFGMADPEEDAKTMQEMARDIKQVDLVLYCTRMDGKRWPKNSDKDTIKKMTKIFSREVWSHCLIVLTFANCAAEHLRLEDKDDTYAAAFSRLCLKWEEVICEEIRKLANLTNDDEVSIRATPVGSYVANRRGENPWVLPDRDDWFLSFWMDVMEQMREGAVPAFLQLNQHRLAGHHSTALDPSDCDDNSVNPIPVNVEAYARRVPGVTPGDDEGIVSQVSNGGSAISSTNQTCTSNHQPRTLSSGGQNIYDEELATSGDCFRLGEEKCNNGRSHSRTHPREDQSISEEEPVSSGSISGEGEERGGNGQSDSHACSSEGQNISERDPASSSGGSGRGGEDDGSPVSQKPSERVIPLEILRMKLKKEGSGFWTYAMEFAKLRGKEWKVVGHIGGFFEGLRKYLSRES